MKQESVAVPVETNQIKPIDVKPGMVVRVHEKIKDVNAKGEERERLQAFEGTVMSVRGAGASRSMTVRKVTGGWGVEKSCKDRRANLSYLTNKRSKFKRPMKEQK